MISEPVAHTTAADLDHALTQCEFPLVVWDAGGIVRLANRSASELVGLPLSELIGRRVCELAHPPDYVRRTVADITSGATVAVQTRRNLVRGHDRLLPVWIWSRALSLDGLLAGVTVFAPVGESARLGRDPLRPWQDLWPVAVGIVDADWHILRISADVRLITECDPDGYLGRRLPDLVHPDDVAAAGGPRPHPPDEPVALESKVRITDCAGGWVEVCKLLAPFREDGRPDAVTAFALVGSGDGAGHQPDDRVRELEMRLRRISAEIRAAGILDTVGVHGPRLDRPQLGDLTTRQWEILTRILQGQRVPAIASELFLSASTVRNHLTTIFRKFGVHSQSELIQLLRRDPDESRSGS